MGLTRRTRQLTPFADTSRPWRKAFMPGGNGSRSPIRPKLTTPSLQNWVLTSLLPWVYWQQQADLTRQRELKHRYQQAAQQAYTAVLNHALTAQLDGTQRQHWVGWCQWMAAKYQRTSSAVEGRNGYLSRLHHAGRGFSDHTLQVLTIIHNFDLKRADSTTAAQRLFDHDFPNLFDWVVEHMGDLPMPRKSSRTHRPHPLSSMLFPA